MTGLAVLALPTLLLSLDLSVLYLALPHMAADLRPSSSQHLWIMDVYGFMLAGFLITMANHLCTSLIVEAVFTFPISVSPLFGVTPF